MDETLDVIEAELCRWRALQDAYALARAIKAEARQLRNRMQYPEVQRWFDEASLTLMQIDRSIVAMESLDGRSRYE